MPTIAEIPEKIRLDKISRPDLIDCLVNLKIIADKIEKINNNMRLKK